MGVSCLKHSNLKPNCEINYEILKDCYFESNSLESQQNDRVICFKEMNYLDILFLIEFNVIKI
jgi:hypothetical protein